MNTFIFKPFIAFVGNNAQKNVCKFCTTPLDVQMLCKTKLADKSVQTVCKL